MWLHLGKPLGCCTSRFCVDCSAFRQGNQVAVRGNMPTFLLKGNRSHWQQRARNGEIQLDYMAQSLHTEPPPIFLFLTM